MPASGLRKCANCGEEKPLDKDYYQVIKSFKSGFSYCYYGTDSGGNQGVVDSSQSGTLNNCALLGDTVE